MCALHKYTENLTDVIYDNFTHLEEDIIENIWLKFAEKDWIWFKWYNYDIVDSLVVSYIDWILKNELDIKEIYFELEKRKDILEKHRNWSKVDVSEFTLFNTNVEKNIEKYINYLNKNNIDIKIFESLLLHRVFSEEIILDKNESLESYIKKSFMNIKKVNVYNTKNIKKWLYSSLSSYQLRKTKKIDICIDIVTNNLIPYRLYWKIYNLDVNKEDKQRYKVNLDIHNEEKIKIERIYWTCN